jgi:hypothetical protein
MKQSIRLAKKGKKPKSNWAVGVYLSAKRAIAKNPLPKKNSFAEIEENRLVVNLAVTSIVL